MVREVCAKARLKRRTLRALHAFIDHHNGASNRDLRVDREEFAQGQVVERKCVPRTAHAMHEAWRNEIVHRHRVSDQRVGRGGT